MVIKSRTSVGITKKPTSTNRKEMRLKVRRTGISKREEIGRETERAPEEEAVAVKDNSPQGPERSTSNKMQSKTTKKEEREETQEARVLPIRSERDLDEVVPRDITTTHIQRRGRSSVQVPVKEAWRQWTESSMRETHTCHLTSSGARTTLM
jgi:hypothetical protein